jgi:hypothetical protein
MKGMDQILSNNDDIDETVMKQRVCHFVAFSLT